MIAQAKSILAGIGVTKRAELSSATALSLALSRDRPLQIVLVVLTLLCFAHAVYFLCVGLWQPIFEFRDTQTALSAYWLWRGDPWIAYETPVLGYPWSIPFEFPIYQWLVALLRWMGIPIEPAGRIVSFAFYVGCLGPLGMLVKILNLRVTTFFYIAILFLLSPIYVFWGRSVMIESCALFFSLLWLGLFASFLRRPINGTLIATILAGSLATLTKVTTFPAYGLLGSLMLLAFVITSWRDSVLLSFSRLKVITLAALAGLIPLVAGYAWAVYADHLKEQNLIGSRLTSEALFAWNFGTLPQRLSIQLYRDVIVDRTFSETFGYGVVGALMAVGCAIGSRRYGNMALAAIVGFLVPFLLFTNLHIVHPYYQNANAALALAAAGLGMASLSDVRRPILALGLLLAVGAGQLAYFHERYAVKIKQDLSGNEVVQTGKLIKQNTNPEDAIVVFGQDWSSALAYLGERKSLTIPGWIPQAALDRVLKDPASVLGGLKLGVIVQCKNWGFNERTPLIAAFLAGRKVIADAGDCELLSPTR